MGSGGFAGRLSTPLRTTLWLFREYMNGGRSGPRSFDRRFQAMWIIWEQTQKGGLLLRTQHDLPHRAAVDAAMPVSSSALAASPPQPSWRIRARKSRSGMAR